MALAIKVVLAVAAFLIAFGMSSFFMREIFPWKHENPGFSDFLAFTSALLLSAVFGLWLFTAPTAKDLIERISTGFIGVITKVLALLFLLIGGFLFWKRVKHTIRVK